MSWDAPGVATTLVGQVGGVPRVTVAVGEADDEPALFWA